MDIETLQRNRLRLEGEFHALRVKRSMARLRAAVKANPRWQAQPRVPTGNPEGGRWTDGGGTSSPNRSTTGARPAKKPDVTGGWQVTAQRTLPQGGTQTLWRGPGGATVFSETGAPGTESRRILVTDRNGVRIVVSQRGEAQLIVDANGDILTQSTSTREVFGFTPVQAAYFRDEQDVGRRLRKLGPLGKYVSPLLDLYEWYSREAPRKRAVLRIDPVANAEGDVNSWLLGEVRQVDEDEVEGFCPRLPEVQSKTTEFYNLLKPQYHSATQLGTAVHVAMRKYVKAQHNRDFLAEDSYSAGESVRYGAPGSIRIDVMERREDGTICVYDLKTGDAGMSRRRFHEIAFNVQKQFREATQYLVVEVRP